MGELRSAVEGLVGREPGELADVALAEELVEIEAAMGRLMGAFLRRLAVFDARCGYADDGCVSSAAWLVSRARLAPGDAAVRVRAARRLRELLPDTDRALAAGEITWPQARILSEDVAGPVLRAADPGPGGAVAAREACARAEAVLVPAARELGVRDTAWLARRWRHAADADGFARDADRVYRRRFLHVSPVGDMVRVDGELDPEGGQAVLAAIGALAGPAGLEDARTPGQRRADALVELAHRALDTATLPVTGGEKPHVTVEVSIDTLERRLGCPPGELTRTGPIPAETARRLACDAGISRIITDPAGEPLDIGRRTRTIPPAIRRALAHRDRGCAWHGCDYPAEWTDAHHKIHWADGGPTSLDNLVLLCRRHHRAVHEGGQLLDRAPP